MELTLAEKYGFTFFKVPGGAENPIVRAFSEAHFRDHGYPAETTPSSVSWIAVTELDQSDVQCVFGFRFLREFALNSFDDFYARKTRRGILACYAALERIKLDADRTGLHICTPTPTWNTAMLRAVGKFFGPPELVVSVYRPKAVTTIDANHVRDMVEA